MKNPSASKNTNSSGPVTGSNTPKAPRVGGHTTNTGNGKQGTGSKGC